MQESWILGGATLLSIFQAICGSSLTERTSPLESRRHLLSSQQWPTVLSSLTAAEAAMLQDLTWWGPLMENRLQRMVGVRVEPEPISRGRNL
jgi:hypothetical protein